MSEALLEAQDLRYRYPDGGFELVLENFVLERAQSVACIGPSGCGKTTLVMLLAAVLAAQQGSLRFAGVDLCALAESARRALRLQRFGLVFQELDLVAWLTAFDNIVLPYYGSSQRRLDDDVRARATDLAASLGVEDVLGRMPGRLSQGERQRVAICRALVTQAEIVFCDEPTSKLDPVNARRSLALLLEEVTGRGASLFCITHDHALLECFDRVVDLEELCTGVGQRVGRSE